MANHPAPPLSVSEPDLETLRALVRARTTEQRLVQRARIVLGAAEGTPNRRIAAELGVTPMTVLLWRSVRAGRPDRPRDEARSGRPPTYGRERARSGHRPDPRATLRRDDPLERPPAGEPGGDERDDRLADLADGRSQAPPDRDVQVLSTDPALEAKVRDVVGLYLAPPERAIVLSLDEKTQIQALDRTAPMLPLRPGQVERHTHDYKRHGTTSLFAALEVATGKVTTEARARHTGADFLAFLRRVERAYPDGELHVVLDNVSTHKTPDVRAWLERHPRITFHFTPTSASWMNQIETWFGILTRQAIRRGSFGSVKELIARIDLFAANWNAGASPFAWVKTADEILAKAVRKRPAISESRH